jgi:23S rRNA (pseudouridine1915-N3)-methyltransferase
VTLFLAGVGRLRPSFRDAVDEYLKRLRRFVPVEEREVREAGRAGNPVAQRREEATRLRAALPAGARWVALDLSGRGWSSEALATRLEAWKAPGKDTAFLIGGATGLDPTVLSAAEERWSLGPLTLPHELVRVVVAEQLYRAATILAGQPYHKGA